MNFKDKSDKVNMVDFFLVEVQGLGGRRSQHLAIIMDSWSFLVFSLYYCTSIGPTPSWPCLESPCVSPHPQITNWPIHQISHE